MLLRKERQEAEEIVEKFYTNISSIASSPTKGMCCSCVANVVLMCC